MMYSFLLHSAPVDIEAIREEERRKIREEERRRQDEEEDRRFREKEAQLREQEVGGIIGTQLQDGKSPFSSRTP